ncbi:thioredoxin domain-containing protein [uncultured Jatrophihabitans sp.]|uniref:thioredoxin domain-containing protein n=1 Tax=uncultured Jatrophihabitans sp. TaxID=1610747 RepID=UPI0035C97243
MNRLSSSMSPYLQQHAQNPVHWWEWSDEALAEARRRDVPILLSVGYAACHWCHVMAHESFENPDIAALMNEHFVNIKVDREERPDIDAVYMTATTALTGHGGWPMTCLLTVSGEPFYAGTYFPPQQFVGLLRSVAVAWREDHDEVLQAGQRIVSALAEMEAPRSAAASLPGAVELDNAARGLAAVFDQRNAGFGRAPKFPPSMVLEFLLRQHERTGDPAPLAMCERTFEAMARGGMYDQLAGGFARYSVDAAWVVPHFEKMLYDNALLLRAYVHWHRLTGSPFAARIARETADFLLRDLRTAEGGFASALDADTDGVEGLTYVWTPAQLTGVLGDDSEEAARLFNVTADCTFEHGASTLQLLEDPPDHSVWSDLRTRLFAARSLRPQPGRDDKVVTAWNGLAIAALTEAAVVLGVPEYLAAAVDCATLLLELHQVDGRLRRTSRDGAVGSAAGVAEDYGDLAEALLALHQATAEPRWLDSAAELLATALDRFADGPDADGGFFDTADDAEQLVRRPRDPTDNATPSGASALAAALLAHSALTGSTRHRVAAENAVRSAGALPIEQPRFFGQLLAVAEGLLAGPVQVAVVGEVGELGELGGGPLTATAWRLRPPGAVVVSGESDSPGVPLLADRPLVRDAPAAYVCRGMVCDLPVSDVDELARSLASR